MQEKVPNELALARVSKTQGQTFESPRTFPVIEKNSPQCVGFPKTAACVWPIGMCKFQIGAAFIGLSYGRESCPTTPSALLRASVPAKHAQRSFTVRCVSPVGNEGSEEPLVTRQVVDGAEIEFVELRTPRLKAYYRRHQIERDGLVVHFGATNLYVPADGCVYVAPSMIAHYVDVHRYEPPAVFWEAVMNCPPMASETYKRALIANGPSNEDWVRAVRAV